MKSFAASIVLLAVSSLALASSPPNYRGPAGSPPNYRGPARVPSYQAEKYDIPTVLTKNGLTTLVDLVVKAGLAETLSGPGPFTVFAPTNEAFAAVDADTLKLILSDVEILKRVLLYHVVASELSPSSIKNELTPRTVEGGFLRINVYGGYKGEIVTVNGALRLTTLEASNGIIYVIDKVLEVPEPQSTIVDILARNEAFTTLVTAVKAAGLASTLQSEGPFTVFAPTNAAFKALPYGLLESLLANPEELKKVLLTHVASGTFYSKGLSNGPLPVLSGKNVEVTVSQKEVKVGNARVIDADLYASNGVIHVIDAVITQTSEDRPKQYSPPRY